MGSTVKATGINPRGDISGHYTDADNGTHSYLLRRGQFHSFDFPDAIATRAIGINARGEIVGYYDGADHVHGFLRSSKGDERSNVNQDAEHDDNLRQCPPTACSRFSDTAAGFHRNRAPFF